MTENCPAMCLDVLQGEGIGWGGSCCSFNLSLPQKKSENRYLLISRRVRRTWSVLFPSDLGNLTIFMFPDVNKNRAESNKVSR